MFVRKSPTNLIKSVSILPTMSFLISATRQKPRPAPKERWHKWPATPLTWQIHSCFRGSDPTNCSRGSQLISTKFLLLVASERWFICGNLQFKLTYFLPATLACTSRLMTSCRDQERTHHPHSHGSTNGGPWKSSTINLQDKMDATGRSTPWGPISCIYPGKKVRILYTHTLFCYLYV